MIMDIEKEENIPDIHFAISGFNLFPLNLKAEWWPTSVGRIAWRISLGYNKLTRKIDAVIQPDCNAERAAKTMKGGLLDMP